MDTVIGFTALLLALAALAYAWRLNRELDRARERLDRYNRSLFGAEESIRTLRGELEAAQAQLRVEMLHRTGRAQFMPSMTVREATLLHPQVQQVLAGFHLGGCNHCTVDPDETLAAVCRRSGVDQAALLANLNWLLDGNHSNANGEIQPMKIPNVQFEPGV